MTDNMGLIDHPLTPLIVNLIMAVSRRVAYGGAENYRAEVVARDLLNTALAESDKPT
jgi:hypothetical protein